MPWFGFFRKLSLADVWVVLDHTENNPREASFWCRRVKILVNGVPQWASLPLAKPPAGKMSLPINQIQINTLEAKRLRNLHKTIEMAYSSAPFFKEYSFLVHQYFRSSESLLIKRNLRFIRDVMAILEITPKVVLSSSLNPEGRKNDLLVELVKKLGGKTYVSGLGAEGYQKDDLFERHQIDLLKNTFEHPSYPQVRSHSFYEGLSICDMLFNMPKQKIISFLHD